MAGANETLLYLLLSLCSIDGQRTHPASNYQHCNFYLSQGDVNIRPIQLFLTSINITENTYTFILVCIKNIR